MIFVTVGTTDFDSLTKEIDRIAPKLKDKVVIQIGNGKYLPKNCEYFRFTDKMNSYYDKASLIISHGGAGTCFEVLALGKKFIAVNNPDAKDEHQSDLLGKLSEDKYLIWCNDNKTLNEDIKRSMNFHFIPYKRAPCTIGEIITNYLGV